MAPSHRRRATPVLDDTAHRRARVRAAAASIVDAPRVSRRFTGEPGRGGRGPGRRRHSAPRRPHQLSEAERLGRRRRLIGCVILAVQLGALAALLLLPTFSVARIDVTGNRLLSRDAIVNAAAVPGKSLFTVDGDAVRDRLMQLPWVRRVVVSTELPNTVRIAITEWTPSLRVIRGGREVFVADAGATISADHLAGIPMPAIPTLVDHRPGSAGTVDSNLVQILDAAAQRFPSVFGCSVAAYEWQADGMLVIWATPGWKAVLGHVDTTDQVAALPAQLSALAALRTQLNFLKPGFGYIDLENAGAPAVGGTPGLPSDIAAIAAHAPPAAPSSAPVAHSETPSLRPSPLASAAPTPTATAVVTPTPTPYVLYLPPPSH